MNEMIKLGNAVVEVKETVNDIDKLVSQIKDNCSLENIHTPQRVKVYEGAKIEDDNYNPFV